MTDDRPVIVSFGEMLWDLFQDQAHIGGAPFNLAAHAVRCGMAAQLISRVGTDELGRHALAEAARLDVGTGGVQVDAAHPTGTVTVRLSPEGQPTYTIHAPVAWDFIVADAAMLHSLQKRRLGVICFGTLAQRHAVTRASLQQLWQTFPAVPGFFDVNLRQNFYSRALVDEGLQHAAVLKLNDGEAAVLSELLLGRHLPGREFARELLSHYPVHIVLLTLGARGCIVVDRTGATEVAGRAVNVADAVGAGDAFSAAFLAFWLRGRSSLEAAIMANELGAFVASRRGAVPDYTVEIQHKLS